MRIGLELVLGLAFLLSQVYGYAPGGDHTPRGLIIDRLYFAKNNPNVVDNFGLKPHYAEAALDSAELEYVASIGPMIGSTTANFVYASFFNPSGSGKTILVKKIHNRNNAAGAATYNNLTVRRISAASGATQVSAANIIAKNASSTNSVVEIRYATNNVGPTVTYADGVNGRIMLNVGAGVQGYSDQGRPPLEFQNEKLVLQPGQGIALYQETAGDADQRLIFLVEWEETANAPSAQSEFILAYPRVEVAATPLYKYQTFFNPAASGKTAVVRRLSLEMSCDTTAVYTNDIAVRRISAASGGTQISINDVPKKHTGSASSSMEFRHTNVTATPVGATTSMLMMVTPCGAAAQVIGNREIVFSSSSEKLILQPGEGIAVMHNGPAATNGDVDQLVHFTIEWQEVASGSTPASQGEYLITMPRVELAMTANQTYHSFFNPAGSGKTALIKRIEARVNADTSATYQAITVRRTTAESGGTQISAADVPKKHTGTSNSVMSLRYTVSGNLTAPTFAGTANSRILTVTGTGAVGQVHATKEIVFSETEPLVIQQGEGIALYTEAAGDVDQYVKFSIEWDEEASAPSSQGEYVITAGPVNGSTSSGYVYLSFLNPATSTKTIVIKQFWLGVDAAAAAVYIPMSLYRITNSTGGTFVPLADIPQKHTGSGTPEMSIRTTSPVLTGTTTNARLIGVTTPGAVGSAPSPYLTGHLHYTFQYDEALVLQPGQGVALLQEAAGDADLRVKLFVEWDEVTSAPSSIGEYMLSMGSITGNAAQNYVYASLFNPATSSKEYVVKRISIQANRSGASTSPAYIPITVRRISSISGGTTFGWQAIPRKHTGTATSTALVSHTGPTATIIGDASSTLLSVIAPGRVGQTVGLNYFEYVYADELTIKPGQGIALSQEQAAGDTNMRYWLGMTWLESTVGGPSSSITLSLSTSTIAFGALVPGTPNTVSATTSVEVSGASSGYNLQLKRDSATSTVTLTTERNTGIPDFTAWDPTTNGNNGNATSTLADIAGKFTFRVQQATTTSNYSTAWWGANDTGGTAKWAGFPTASQKIMDCASCTSGITFTAVKYRIDALATQKNGTYDGTLTFTALANP